MTTNRDSLRDLAYALAEAARTYAEARSEQEQAVWRDNVDEDAYARLTATRRHANDAFTGAKRALLAAIEEVSP